MNRLISMLRQSVARPISGNRRAMMNSPKQYNSGGRTMRLLTGAALLGMALVHLPAPYATVQGAEVDRVQLQPQPYRQQPVAPTIHIVEPGDVLSNIAALYGVSVAEIMAANGLVDPDVLQVGQELIIPGANSPAIPTPALSTPTPDAFPLPTIPAATQAIPQATPEATVPAMPQANIAAGAELFLCPANSQAYNLTLPADPIRLAVAHDRLYFVAYGDLFYLALTAMGDAPTLNPISVMPSNRRVGPYTIQELVYVTQDAATGDLILLDKNSDIYRYSATRGWRMAFAAAPVPGQFPDPQFLAVHANGDSIYALDADLSHLWRFAPGAVIPARYLIHSELQRGVDYLWSEANGSNAPLVLTYEGAILRFQGGQATTLFHPSNIPGQIPWPAQIANLGTTIATVDAQSRRVSVINPATGQLVRQISFRFPAMQRLRSIAMAGDTLFGVGGNTLYVGTLANLTGTCPQVAYDDRYYFAGVDLLAVAPRFTPPVAGAEFPVRPRSYPGARRLYRYGIHEGVDFYITEAAGLVYGSPVRAMADGTITRNDSDFVEMTPAEYEAAIVRTEQEHQTPLALADKLRGQQVFIVHNDFVESRYAHLSAVAAGNYVGKVVQQGEALGSIGVSGTSAGAYGTTEGTHLHFEVWVKGRYLGHGLTLYETWRLWVALFDLERPATHATLPPPTATAPASEPVTSTVSTGAPLPAPTSTVIPRTSSVAPTLP